MKPRALVLAPMRGAAGVDMEAATARRVPVLCAPGRDADEA
jgi:hypothetical protein